MMMMVVAVVVAAATTTTTTMMMMMMMMAAAATTTRKGRTRTQIDAVGEGSDEGDCGSCDDTSVSPVVFRCVDWLLCAFRRDPGQQSAPRGLWVACRQRVLRRGHGYR